MSRSSSYFDTNKNFLRLVRKYSVTNKKSSVLDDRKSYRIPSPICVNVTPIVQIADSRKLCMPILPSALKNPWCFLEKRKYRMRRKNI